MIQNVIKSYCKAAIISFILICFIHCLAIWINTFHFFSKSFIQGFQSFSIIPIATSVLGQKGWEIQTYGGISPAEKMNQKLFKIISIIGFFLAVFAFHLKPAS